MECTSKMNPSALTPAIRMFIDLLDEEGEGRILTGTLVGGSYCTGGHFAFRSGCLVGLGVGLAGKASYDPHDRMAQMIRPIVEAGVGSTTADFDYLYNKDRQATAAAIYQRIRANRAKRAAPTDTLAKIVPEPIRDLVPA